MINVFILYPQQQWVFNPFKCIEICQGDNTRFMRTSSTDSYINLQIHRAVFSYFVLFFRDLLTRLFHILLLF